jgi:multidrug efflux pump subunit AcrB
MNLAAIAIENKTVTWFAVVVILIGGLGSYFQLPQLEDPAFTVKTAVVTTSYPGATAEEVELEVTDRLEQGLMEMKEIRYVESMSRPGFSMIRVEMKPEYWSDKLPQIFDEMRRKVQKMEGSLPPGAGKPEVADDYGQVFGLLLAITGDGFSYEQLERYAKDLRKELSTVDGVARVDFWGQREKVVNLDTSQTQLANLGISEESITETLRNQNMVVDAGSVDVLDHRLRIQPTGQFQSPRDIGNLTVRPTVTDVAQQQGTGRNRRGGSELIRIADMGTISRGLREPPTQIMRFNGQQAIGLALAPVVTDNIVAVGQRVDARLDELIVDILPVGIDVHRIHWQSDVVDEAVVAFLINFAEALAIVLVVVTIPMGWRMGVIIGTNLVLTVFATFIIMSLWGIELHRISLGALIIALGMMVDNAIVVADEMTVKIQQGMDRMKAATEAVAKHQMPLIGATVIAVMAFFPIAMSSGDTGEYCQHLFYVAGASLLASWLLALTVTPLQCVTMLPEPKGDADPYAGGFFQGYRKLLGGAVRFRWLTLAGVYGVLFLSIVGFGLVEQLFFPNSSMPKFMVDFYAPYGTRIQDVAADLEDFEKKLVADERVQNVSTFIGSGPPRFYLPVQPEDELSNYAQLIVNVHDYRDVEDMVAELDAWAKERYPNAVIPIKPYVVGISKTWQFEVRISGPAEADPEILRAIASNGAEVVETSPHLAVVRSDWQQRVPRLVPEYNRDRARWSNVTREDLAQTTKRAYDGRDVGLYREGDDLIPIVMRFAEDERQAVDGLPDLQVKSAMSTEPVPLSQVTDGVRTEWVDDMIWRRDRRRTMKLQANPLVSVTLPTMREQIADDVFAVTLPPGYKMEWGGVTEDEIMGNAQLIPGIVPAVIVMLFIMVALFNSFREPLIIILTVPLAIIGVTVGLLVTGFPFGFIALLGVLSLSGMMIKNVIVLLDEIKGNKAQGMDEYDAIVKAAMSRLRPVLLTSATTFLGVLPLIQDVLWSGLAVAISGGLLFGTIITMVFVPTLYAIVFKVREGKSAEPEPEPAAA